MILIKNKSSAKILYSLIAGDVAFLILAVLQRYTGYFDDVRFSLTYDHSYAEFYQYAKELFIAITFVRLSYLRRLLGYLAWSGLFTYFFLLIINILTQVHILNKTLLTNHLYNECDQNAPTHGKGHLYLYVACD